MNLTEPQIAALEADRLKLIVVPLDPQPDYVFHSVVDGSVKEMQRTIGENAYGQEQRVTVPFPYTIGDRIPTPHGNLIVTDVQVKRVQDVTVDEALNTEVQPDMECCNAPYVNQIGPDDYEQVCCGNPDLVTDPRSTFRDHFNTLYPDAWDRDPWSCFITVERVSE